jgi:leucyl/phenylalanyl-tRNA--protein transferase
MIPADLLLRAYASGWFPMAADRVGSAGIEWFSPDPRGILPINGFHIPARLERLVRTRRFEVRIDTVFADVVRACADRDETWISQAIFDSYVELHRIGYGHSIEAWREGRLVGGLYGVSLRGAFFGESMFHRDRDASKVALHALVERLKTRGYALLDVQWATTHLQSFGAIEVPRRKYLKLLSESMKLDCRFA